MHAYQSLPDPVLFDLIRRGDEHAFRAIYDRYFDVLYAHAYQKLRNREDAQDVTQELFTVLWDKRRAIAPKGNLLPYLYTSIRNRVINIIARKKVESVHIQSLQGFINRGSCQTDYLVRERQLSAIIDEEIAALPPRMQEIFELSRRRYLSHKEIAAVLNLSEQTVKKQVNNALRILRTKLGMLLLAVLLVLIYY